MYSEAFTAAIVEAEELIVAARISKPKPTCWKGFNIWRRG